MLSNFWSLLITLFVLSLSLPVLTIPTNVTIDDTKGDERTGVVPVYSPANSWNVAGECPSCVAQPDTTQVKDGTWHDTSTFTGNNASMTVEIKFTGTAAYAYFVTMNVLSGAVTLTNLSFSMDGKDAGTFVHIPETSGPTYQYNVNGFAKTNLENTPHTLTITNNGFFNGSLVLFDYMLYTAEDDTESITTTDTSTSTSTSSSTSPSSTSPSSTSPTSTSPSATSPSATSPSSTSPSASSPSASSPSATGPSFTSLSSTSPSSTQSIGAGSSSDASHSRVYSLGVVVGVSIGCVMSIVLAV